MNGLFSLGGALGALSTAYTAEAFGRLRTIQLAICILGASLMTGSANVAMFLARRLIMGWGTGQIICAGKLLYPFPGFLSAYLSLHQSRCTKQSYLRLSIVAYMLASMELRLLLATRLPALLALASTSSFQWRFPFAIQLVRVLILLAGSWALPESP
jgi:MFS family permease